MSPGVGGILPREVLPGGIDVDGHHFPPGVDLGVPIYCIQHNEAYFPRPFEFVPERWISKGNDTDDTNTHNDDNNDENDNDKPSNPNPTDPTYHPKINNDPESVALARSAFSAFGVGPRACVGKSMAYKEITIVIARLIWSYEMRLAPERTEGEGDPRKSRESGRHRRGEYQGIDKFVLQADGPIVQFRVRKR